MARTIAEIKKEMTDRFMNEENIQKLYDIEPGTEFDRAFAKASIENIFFYIAATCMWTLEKLFDYHRQEVTGIIDNLKPHSLRWYVSKAKAFMLGKELLPDSDEYDTSGMTADQIEAARVVKYASATDTGGVVFLKIAGEKNGEPAPIPDSAFEGFQLYIREVKDAGVVVQEINRPADHFRLTMTIFYNPMVMNNTGVVLAGNKTGSKPVQETIKAFIKNLPFNGEYRNVSLVDELQKIEGVVIPEFREAYSCRDGEDTNEENWKPIEGKATPYAGYYKIYDDENDLKLTFEPYETRNETV